MGIIQKVAAAGALAVAALAGTTGLAHGQAIDCTGNKVIDHAPYTCTDSRTINGITFHITLSVDATGQATVDYVMSPVQTADIAIAVHSYKDINVSPEFVTGVIRAGQTTGRLVVPRIECGQLDIKAVKVTPGDTGGNIAGPQVTWGDVCQVVPTTTTTTTTAPPPTVSPTSVSPTSVSPTSVTPTIPNTGAGGVVPWTWSLPFFALAAALILLSRRRRPAQ